MKSLLSSLFAIVFLMNSISITNAAIFSDVPDNHPQATAIEYVKSKNIINGYPDGTYKPENTINRAEFTKILMSSIIDKNTIDTCLNTNPLNFTDVDYQDWYASFVCIAKHLLIINGYVDGRFKPGNNINYAEAAKIIAISYDLTLISTSPDQAWYETYTKALENMNAVPASIKSADQNITRGEMAEMIYLLRNSSIDSSLQNTDPETTDENTSTGDYSTERQAVIDIVNQERAKEGLAPMKHNPFLEKSAQAHAEDMLTRNYFEHDTPQGVTAEDRIKRDGYLQPFFDCQCTKSYTVGENIAKGQSTAAEVMETWMNSPQHRANIMSADFNEIGIGIIPVDPSDTGFIGFYWVQNFGAISLQ